MQVFIEDTALQGRYTLAAERDERPAGTPLLTPHFRCQCAWPFPNGFV